MDMNSANTTKGLDREAGTVTVEAGTFKINKGAKYAIVKGDWEGVRFAKSLPLAQRAARAYKNAETRIEEI